MDLFKQVGKKLRKIGEESEHNSRRYKENFPYLERKVDEVVFDKPYKMEFFMSDHPHSVHLNLYLKPPTSCFKCDIQYGTPLPDTVSAKYSDSVFPDLGSVATPAQWLDEDYNNGGFIQTTEGIQVPEDGIYNVRFQLGLSGVTSQPGSTVAASVRHNGVILAQKVYSVNNGRLPSPPAFFALDIDMYGLCIAAREGDTINGWLLETGIPAHAEGGGILTFLRVALV